MAENYQKLEGCYQKAMSEPNFGLYDGIEEITIDSLHRLGLLNSHNRVKKNLTHYFQIVESVEKIVLSNEQFVVWIIPKRSEGGPATYVLIGLKQVEGVILEKAFSTTGIYNSSYLVLQVLEQYLNEIQETEEMLSSLKKKTMK